METNKPKLVYFTAQDARKVSDECSEIKMNKELDDIYDKINIARYQGYYQITLVDRKLSPLAENFLKGKGFKVEYFYGDQRDPANDTIIKW